jgi:RNA polymerase sporulation-specific sigma factor
LVKNVSRKFFLVGAETDDLYQEGFLGLMKAVKNYTPGKSNFLYYAHLCINSAIVTAVRKYSGGKNKVLNDGLPLSEVDGTFNFSENPEQLYIEGEHRREVYSVIQKQLSTFEKEVLSLYLQGLSYAEIQERTGKPFKSIDNALQRIRKKVKN